MTIRPSRSWTSIWMDSPLMGSPGPPFMAIVGAVDLGALGTLVETTGGAHAMSVTQLFISRHSVLSPLSSSPSRRIYRSKMSVGMERLEELQPAIIRGVHQEFRVPCGTVEFEFVLETEKVILFVPRRTITVFRNRRTIRHELDEFREGYFPHFGVGDPNLKLHRGPRIPDIHR